MDLEGPTHLHKTDDETNTNNKANGHLLKVEVRGKIT